MLNYLNMGGWALWVITGCSIIALGITLERLLTLHKAGVDSDDLLDQVSQKIDNNDIDGALEICAAKSGPVADTLAIGLRKLVFLERIGKKPEEIEEGIVAAMEDHGGHVVNWLEQNLTMLATIASLAPILGMMGTVVGMIRAFLDSAAANNMTPAIVGKGIGEALLCTAGGLIVAALSTVEYNYFTARVNRFVLQVQAAGTQLVERVLDSQMHQRRNTNGEPAESDAVLPRAAPDGSAGREGNVVKFKRRPMPAPHIPFISLADIAWQIIIFFFMAASFTKLDAMSVKPPSSTAEAKPQQDKTTTILAKNDGLSIDGVNVAMDQLVPELALRLRDKKKDEEKVVIIDGSKDLTHQRNVEIIFAIRKAGGTPMMSAPDSQ